LCFIQTTSPLVLPSDLDSGIKKVVSGEYDSVFSTTVETWIPKWIEAGDVVKPVNWTPTKRPRRQQMPELLIENGAFYITTKKQLMESKLRYSGKIGSVEMPLKRSFQIDTTDELELIRSIIKNGVHYD
jgi:CMP-N-acetylneuraminic acid synthetase